MVTKKHTYSKQHWKTIYEVIDYDCFEQPDTNPPREFLTKCKREYNVVHFIPVGVKQLFKKLVLNMDAFQF